jgi:hypothetical protein
MKNRRVSLADKAIAFIMLGPVASLFSVALGDEPFIQADVYNALYEAYVQCDDDFGQSRSEFITEKLEYGSGQITIASLKKILSSNIEIANQAIAQESAEREFYVAEILGGKNKSVDQPEDPAEEDKKPHKEVREIDAFLRERRRYVEIHECVLETLQDTHSQDSLAAGFGRKRAFAKRQSERLVHLGKQPVERLEL